MFEAMMRRAVVFAVWDSSMVVSASSEPKEDDWETSEVQRRKVAANAVTVEAMLTME